MASWFIMGALLVGAGIATVTDLRSRRIPNALTGPLFVVLLLLRAWQVRGVPWESLLAAAAVMLFFGLMAALGQMGWGDVKLAGALAAAGGVQFAVAMVLFASLLGGVVALLHMMAGAVSDVLATGERSPAAIGAALIVALRARGRTAIPYGPVLAAGALAAALRTPGLPA